MKIIHVTNALFNFLDYLGWNINSLLRTICTKCICALKGVKISKGCSFYGKTKFKRARTANIIIGRFCTFRSASTSNLIGINRPCIISALEPDASIIIGNNCGFSGTVIGCFKEIIIGDNVKCGANSLITDSDWHLEDPRSSNPKPILIGNNVWLGVNVVVMKGVVIGENSVIGAGSIVTKNIPPNVIAAGNPCRIIRQINIE